MEINAETYTHYLNAKNRTHLNKSPNKMRRSLKAAKTTVSELLRHEIWTQSMKQLEGQLLNQGNVSVPHLGIFWIAKQESPANVLLPGLNSTATPPAATYAIHFLIDEYIAPQMYRMKQPILGKSLPHEPEGLDTRRIALDLGSVSKERVRTFFKEFARQLAKEIRSMNVSAQLAVSFADMGKAVFTATNYGVRWDKNFVKKVKDSIRRLRDNGQPASTADQPNDTPAAANITEKAKSNGVKAPRTAPSMISVTSDGASPTNKESSLPVLGWSPQKGDEPSPKTKASKKEPRTSLSPEPRATEAWASPSNKQNGASPQKSPFGSGATSLFPRSSGFELPSQSVDETDDEETRQKKAQIHKEWKRQIRERELAAQREAEADRKLREMNEYVAELFSESERKKFEEKRSREKRTMQDNLQIAQVIKNIRQHTDEVVECGDIFQKRRSDHPVFSKEQLKEDLRQQMIEKQQRLLAEKKLVLNEERKEFVKMVKANANHRDQTYQNQLRKKEYQKILLQQQMRERERQTHAMFDEERRREMAEQVLVPGHDDEIARNSKLIAKELQRQALEDAARKQKTQKQIDEESKALERAIVDYARMEDQKLKLKAKEKTKNTQKEMKSFWDGQVGVSQWKNPVLDE